MNAFSRAQLFFFFFTLFLLNSLLLCFPISALSWQRSNGSESNNVLLRPPFHLPASKTSLWSQRTLLETERHRLHILYVWVLLIPNHTIGLSPPYSQTAVCAVLHEIQTAFFPFFSFVQTKEEKWNDFSLNPSISNLNLSLYLFRCANVTNIIHYNLLLQVRIKLCLAVFLRLVTHSRIFGPSGPIWGSTGNFFV